MISRYDYENLSSRAVKRADPESFTDRLFLNYYVSQCPIGRVCEMALEKLGGKPDISSAL